MEIERKKARKSAQKKNISYINHYLQFKDPKICELLAKAGLVMILLSVIIIGQNSGTECSNLSDYITLTQEKKLISLNSPKHDGYKSFQPDVSRLKQALELTEKLIFTVESHRRALIIILHKTSMQEICLRSYITILQYFGQKVSGWHLELRPSSNGRKITNTTNITSQKNKFKEKV
jgi:hypothetical protein